VPYPAEAEAARKLADLFRHLDTGNTGLLTLTAFQNALELLDEHLWVVALRGTLQAGRQAGRQPVRPVYGCDACPLSASRAPHTQKHMGTPTGARTRWS